MMNAAESILQWVDLPIDDDHVKAVSNLIKRWAEADEGKRRELTRQHNREAILAELATIRDAAQEQMQ
jgi:hypothetical protein